MWWSYLTHSERSWIHRNADLCAFLSVIVLNTRGLVWKFHIWGNGKHWQHLEYMYGHDCQWTHQHTYICKGTGAKQQWGAPNSECGGYTCTVPLIMTWRFARALSLTESQIRRHVRRDDCDFIVLWYKCIYIFLHLGIILMGEHHCTNTISGLHLLVLSNDISNESNLTFKLLLWGIMIHEMKFC